MSLYGDLPATRDGKSKTSKPMVPAFKKPMMFKPKAIAIKPRMAPPQVVSKPPTQMAPPLAALGKPRPPVPIVPRMLGVPRALSQKSKPKVPSAGSPTGPKPVKAAPPPVFATLGGMSEVVEEVVKASDMQTQPFESEVHNEYNPARPNDYEEYCMEREKKKKEAERRQRQEEEFKSRVITPPAKVKMDLKMSADDVFARRQAMSKPKPKATPAPMAPPSLPSRSNQDEKPAAKRQKLEPPSRVVLLRNMVGRGEVDVDLRDEIGSECMKYGNVLKCKVHEVMNKQTPDDEAVRIFVQFSTITAASKAVKAMAGRFFGGRTVKGGHFSEEKFHKDLLAP